MAYLAGSLFSAGAETVRHGPSTRGRQFAYSGNHFVVQTAGTITTLILAAARHPNAQARVQEQMDTIIGRDRSQSSRLQRKCSETDWISSTELQGLGRAP